MKPNHRCLFLAFISLAAVFLLGAPPAWAAGFDRATYDIIMRWVNFLILAALFFKYGRGPIINFLTNQKDQIKEEIELLEEQKRKVVAEIEAARVQLKHRAERIEQIKQKIIADGTREKERIIEQARRESRHMLESAGHKMEHHIRQARETIRAEMIDQAIALAVKRLPEIITRQDADQFVHRFIEAAEKY